MSDRTAGRREHLIRALRADGLDAFLVASATNVRYLTGFRGEAATLLVREDCAIVISDGRFATQLADECPDVEAHIRPIGQAMAAGVAEVVGKLAVRRLGFEADATSVAEFEAIKGALPSVEFRGLVGKVEALRMVKDAGEIEEICAAVRMAERAFAMLRAGLGPHDSEKDATDALEGYLRRCGASGSSFPPIVAVGANSALPHYQGTEDVRIGAGDFVLFDWGAAGRPYKSDLTRVLATGKVTAKLEEVHRAVLAAQSRAISAIRPGVPARDVDAEARSAIEEAGFGGFFPHGLGHGIGMDIHEAPFLRRESDIPLLPGMVITVEPGIYLPGWGGVRIEDDVLVTPDGAEVLSTLPREFDDARP